MNLDVLADKLAELQAVVRSQDKRIEKLERERRKPAHWADFSPKQRAAVEEVTARTDVAWNSLAASGRGPAPHARARRILCSILASYCAMSDSQIANFVGRSTQAVSKSMKAITDDEADTAEAIIDHLYATAEAKAQAAEAKDHKAEAKKATELRTDWWD